MTDKKHGFEDLPGDEDTISGGRLIKIGDLEAVHELWSWDGVVRRVRHFQEEGTSRK